MRLLAELQRRKVIRVAHFHSSLVFGAKGPFEEALAEARLAQPDAPAGDAGGIALLALAHARDGASP